MESGQQKLPILINLETNDRYTLRDASITLGRAPENQIVLADDRYASASHTRIFWDQGNWWAEDLMSSNGTSINDQLLSEPKILTPNDVIKVGRTRFRIE